MNYELLVIFVAGFLLRSYFIIKYGWFGVDSFRNLYLGDLIRYSRQVVPGISRFPGEKKSTYLPGLPLIISLFPRWTHHYIQLLSPMFDIINGLLLWWLLPQYVYSTTAQYIGVLVYVLSPLLIYQSVSLTARPFANFFLSIALLGIHFYTVNGGLVLIVISMVFSGLIYLFNRVTVQSMIVILIGLVFFLKSLVPVWVFAGGLIFSLIISRGASWELITTHLKLIQYFFQTGSIYERKVRITKAKILLKWFPLIIFTPGLYFINTNDPIIVFCLVWFLAVLVISIFWIGGRGHFHLTNGILPFSFLISVLIDQNINYDLKYIIIGLSLLMAALVIILMFSRDIQSYLGNKFNGYIINGNLIGCFDVLNRIASNDEAILPIPMRLGLASLYFTKINILASSGSSVSAIKYGLENLLPYNFSNLDLSRVIDHYRPQYILIQKDYVHYSLLNNPIQNGSLKLIEDNSDCMLLQIVNYVYLNEYFAASSGLSKDNYSPMGYK
jgi:hypothetical protein